MSEHSIAVYARELRPALRSDAFAPARSRLWWLPVHLLLISASTVALAKHWIPWALAPLVSVLAGASFAGLTFLGHETLHGAVVRGKRLRALVGWFGFFPFAISPRLWVAWHNRVHHGHTNRADVDPDAYPTLAAYGQSRAVRFATSLAPGLRRLRGLVALTIGFSIQSTHMLCVSGQRGYLSRREHVLAALETLLGVAVWAAVADAVGPLAFLFAYVLPLIIANIAVMSLILTNHTLSPLTAVNDPLANSLSVTLPAALEWLTLGFGYHVEHHLFPAMSARHAPGVRELLRARWPSRYQSMPLSAALLALHRTPRVYKDPKTLVDPRSAKEWPTLGLRVSIVPK
ncbi:MAG: fatty acid desaturase [Polyangiaceae bacterium]